MKQLQQLILSVITVYGSKYIKTIRLVVDRRNWFYSAASHTLSMVLPPKFLRRNAVQPTIVSTIIKRILLY